MRLFSDNRIIFSNMKSLRDTFLLLNGTKIPCVGFGTHKIPNGNAATTAVATALSAGYRHIDTAALYGNEESVGQAVRESGIAREEIFVTSKVWNSDRGCENTLRAFEKSLTLLGLNYIDLYLIHWPAVSRQFSNWEEINLSTWRALEKLYSEGKVRAIGVSNFMPHHLCTLLDGGKIAPMVNQIEIHGGFLQQPCVDFCKNHNIVVEAWSPLGKGALLDEPTVVSIAEKLGRTPAQIYLRWLIQKEIIPLPKSVTPERIASNAEMFNFVLDAADMIALDSIPPHIGKNPDEVDF